MTTLENLWDLVRAIPPGCVASYGDLGKAMSSPVSGVLVGKWMANCPPEFPWWRVVGKGGNLLVAARDPRMAIEQRRLLLSEGIGFDGETVCQEFFIVP